MVFVYLVDVVLRNGNSSPDSAILKILFNKCKDYHSIFQKASYKTAKVPKNL